MTAKSNRAAFAKLQDYARRSEAFTPGKGKSGDNTQEWSGVTFRLGEAQLTCNIERVQEILPVPSATPIPGAKPWILGLANVRGALMTVIDLNWFLTGNRTNQTARSRLLATGSQKSPLGLLIDDVVGQRHFLTTDATEASLNDDSPLKHLVEKQYAVGTESWQELELDSLFNMAEFLNGSAA